MRPVAIVRGTEKNVRKVATSDEVVGCASGLKLGVQLAEGEMASFNVLR